jgi:tRNA (guanine-N7-)-methyltransferase
LGCGKGEYTIGLAERNPNANYIGIDVKGSSFLAWSKNRVENGLNNVSIC